MSAVGAVPIHAGIEAVRQAALVRCLLVGEVDDRCPVLLAQELALQIDTVRNSAAALQALDERPVSLAVVDVSTPRVHGLQFLEAVHDRRPPLAVIGLASPTAVSEAARAVRLGACDVLPSPPSLLELIAVLRRVLDEQARRRYAADEARRRRFTNLIGNSPAMEPVFALIDRVAASCATVLIEGETGTGKEQVARAIHAAALDRTGPFVPVNCAALPATLLESELFGHEKGSFTGAVEQRMGRLELADKGTLFLDEVSDIPLPMQAKLLRFLQERRFERLGGMETLEVDVRVIGATHRCLQRWVRAGKFRDDLYYRLNVIKIEVPPLRERPEDIPLLARHFSARYARDGGTLPIAPEALEILLDHPWPGNVRELENVIERSCVTAWSGPILPEHLPPEVSTQQAGVPHFHIDLERPLPELLHELAVAVEQHYLRKALRKSQGRIGRCAEICGLSRRSVTTKLRDYHIARPHPDGAAQ